MTTNKPLMNDDSHLLDAAKGRHPSTQHMARLLVANPNLPEPLLNLSERFEDMAYDLMNMLPDNPELTAGLRKLWEAKNSFVATLAMKEHANYNDR